MRACSSCGVVKEEDEFNWRWQDRGIRWGICRECQRKQKTNWYERHKDIYGPAKNARTRASRVAARQYVFDYLSTHPCVECGENDPMVLEFDHIGSKRKTIAELIRDGASIQSLQREIDQCQVMCANCHRRKTMKARGWFRSRQ
jgi:hypothetical protein